MLTQPRTTFANGVNPFGRYVKPTKERRPYVHLENCPPALSILQCVQDNPGILTTEIKTKLKVRSLYNYLRTLVRDGLVRQEITEQLGPNGLPLRRCYAVEGTRRLT